MVTIRVVSETPCSQITEFHLSFKVRDLQHFCYLRQVRDFQHFQRDPNEKEKISETPQFALAIP